MEGEKSGCTPFCSWRTPCDQLAAFPKVFMLPRGVDVAERSARLNDEILGLTLISCGDIQVVIAMNSLRHGKL